MKSLTMLMMSYVQLLMSHSVDDVTHSAEDAIYANDVIHITVNLNLRE